MNEYINLKKSKYNYKNQLWIYDNFFLKIYFLKLKIIVKN